MGPQKQDRPPLVAVDGVPRRDLRHVGAYVRFAANHKAGRSVIGTGSVGVIVEDVRGICKPGTVPVKVPGMKGYLAVPEDRIEMAGRP